MPELPELEAVRIRLGPRLEGKLITAASVNPKKAHMLRYPVDNFADELPARRIVSLTRRGKHLVFGTELGGGGARSVHDPHRGPAGAAVSRFSRHGPDLLGGRPGA